MRPAADTFHDGVFQTPYQYTEEELKAAVKEAARVGGGVGSGHGVAVHATGEPGTGYAVAAGVASVDHAYQLSDATMAAMKAKQIYAVPTFAIAEYFADHAATPERAEHERAEQAFHAAEFASSWQRACRWRWAAMSGRFRMGRRRASWS